MLFIQILSSTLARTENRNKWRAGCAYPGSGEPCTVVSY